MNGDYLCNTLSCYGEGVVSLSKGLHHRQLTIDGAQAFVIDDEEGIDILSHFLNTVESLVDFACTLEFERNSNNTYGKDIKGTAFACYNWCCTCSGTTTHAGCDKRHAGAVIEHVTNLLDTLFGSIAGPFRAVAGTKAFLTQLQMDGHRRVSKSLGICVTKNKGYIMYSLAIHVVYCITTTTTNANDFDDAFILGHRTEINNVCHSCLFFWVSE